MFQISLAVNIFFGRYFFLNKAIIPSEYANYIGSFLHNDFMNSLYYKIIDFSIRLLASVLLIYIGRKFVAIFNLWLKKWIEHTRIKNNKTLIDFSLKSIRYTMMVFVWMSSLALLGVDVAPFVASLGITGFIVGFAFKDALSNFAAGLLVMIYRPFEIDHDVEISGVSGTVDEINVVSTVLRTKDGKKIFIPNSKVWGNNIVNFSALSAKRVDKNFSLPPTYSISDAIYELKSYLSTCEHVIQKLPKHVYVLESSNEGPKIEITAWAESVNIWRLSVDIEKKIEDILSRNKIHNPDAKEGV